MGPDGSIYASAFAKDSVYRFDGQTGQCLGAVITDANALDGPRGLTFGPDGMLYVSSANNARIFQYSPQTGTVQRFNAVGSLTTPIGLSFGPDGDLFVADVGAVAVVRIDGNTGTSLGTFAKGPLTKPQGLLFGPDGDLYVANQDNYRILRFDGTTGVFESNFVTRAYPFNPVGMAFADDYFFTTNQTGGANYDGLLMFNGQTGTYLEPVFNGGGNFWASGLAVLPAPEPGSLALLAGGTLGLLARRRNPRK